MKQIFFVLILLSSHVAAWANGGCTSSPVYKSGDPHFIKVKNVELASEKLDMKVAGDSTHVHVMYRLHNLSDQSTGKLNYGFPVECILDPDFNDDEWDSAYVSNLSFQFNGKTLKVTSPEAMHFKMPNADGDSTEVHLRKWFYTEFSIDAHDLVTLEVDYFVQNNYEDCYTSKSFLTDYGIRSLLYDFSPASCWGNGLVKDFQVNIDMRAVSRIDSYTLDEKDYKTVSGLDFKKDNGVFSYSKADFDLRDATPLTINYDMTSNYLYQDRLPKSAITSIKASSTLAGNYDVRNLLDSDFSTSWAEGATGSGIGEWVELTVKQNYTVGAIFLVNGYVKSEKSYTENNRVKKLKLEIHFANDPGENSNPYSNEITLNDLPYQKINLHNFIQSSSNLFGAGESIGGDSGIAVSHIKIIILDVYKGTTYDDTCMSKLFLLGRKLDDDSSN